MKRTVNLALGMILIFCAVSNISAQTLSVSVAMSPSPSPYFDDWSSGKEKIFLTINSASTAPSAVKISAQLEKDGNIIAATKASNPLIRTVAPGTTTINGADILQKNSIDFTGPDADAARGLRSCGGGS